jgi:glutamyl-tRNA synthetase
MGWEIPEFGHMPLLHGADGAKLSKRHGALGVEAYRDMGFLNEAMFNYLLRLGWGHGDDEIISREEAIKWFTLEGVGKSPARFDMEKLTSLNAHYIREADDARLVDLICPLISDITETSIDDLGRARLMHGLAGLKPRATTLPELAEKASFYVAPRPLKMTKKAAKQINEDAIGRLKALIQILEGLDDWKMDVLEEAIRGFVEATDIQLGNIAQPLRAATTGRTDSPGLFEVLEVLGREETLLRIQDVTDS